MAQSRDSDPCDCIVLMQFCGTEQLTETRVCKLELFVTDGACDVMLAPYKFSRDGTKEETADQDECCCCCCYYSISDNEVV